MDADITKASDTPAVVQSSSSLPPPDDQNDHFPKEQPNASTHLSERPGMPLGPFSFDDTYLPPHHRRTDSPCSDNEGGGSPEEAADSRCVRTAPPSPAKRHYGLPVRQSVLKSMDPKISTIRQHYYPEGGWGWLICACGFVVQMMTTGLQLAYGVLYVEILREFGQENAMIAMWLGALSLSSGFFLAPGVVALCRRKSTRLTAVFGGLASALGCLFTSFASQIHQVMLSYGLFMAVGLGVAREASNLMVGQYFKRRRECVELIIQSGIGVGITVFSAFLRNVLRTLGWRLGLQATTGVLFSVFFLGICYRSASMYHPQRRAILHLKNQRKKVKDKNVQQDKAPFFDFSVLRTKTIQVAMLSSSLASLAVYTPCFYFVYIADKEGLEGSSILMLQTFLGFAFTLGCCVFGFLLIKRSTQCLIARQYLCQASMVGIGVAILSFCAVHGYHGYVLFVWFYGIFCGGFQYALKMFVFEKVRARNFGRAWGFVQWSQFASVLVGIPVTGYINNSRGPKVGFFFSSACAFLGAMSLFLVNLCGRRPRRQPSQSTCVTCELHSEQQLEPEEEDEEELDDISLCKCGNSLTKDKPPPLAKCQQTISFATSVNVLEDKRQELLTCISEEGLLDLGDLNVLEEWCDAECLPSSNKEDKFLVISDFENSLKENSSRPTRRTSHPARRHQQHHLCEEHVHEVGALEDCCDPGVVKAPKRTMTVIEEVTSTV